MKTKNYIRPFVAAIIGLLLLVPAIIRDLKLEASYPSDLRNRQIGSRLIKDGRLPYFYHYNSSDGTRYLDIKNCNSLSVANITATPYLHELLLPICDLPFRKFSAVWLVLCYALLIVMYLLMQSLAPHVTAKAIVWVTAIAFPYTEAWKTHIYQGQYYLLVPFFLVLFYWAFVQKPKWFNLLLVGFACTSVVLIRPTSILLLLPFVFLFKRYKQQLLAMVAFGIVALAIVTGNAFQRNLWSQYSRGIAEHVKIHQHLNPATQLNMSCPVVEDVEGFNLKVTGANIAPPIFSECGNFHTIWKMAFKQQIPLNLLYSIEAAIIAVSFLFYFLQHKKEKTFSLLNACMLGFAFTMVADLFAPINRGQYNTVQWLFPLLLLSQVAFSKELRWYCIIIWLGFALNIFNLGFLKMEHTIGEYLMLVGCICLSLKKLPQAFLFTGLSAQPQST